MKTTLSFSIVVVLGAFASACATVAPPRELLDARKTYNQVAQGPANQVDPTAVHEAAQSLATAENEFHRSGDAQSTRDLAYAAQRKAQLAEAEAQVKIAQQNKAQAAQQVQITQAQIGQRTQAELAQTKQQLAQDQAAIQNQQIALNNEQRARIAAEQQAQQAAAALAAFAAVKQEPRGMVITLNGSVLFETAKYALLPQAKQKLDQVADALQKQNADAKITVEGYTDSQGSAAFNQTLSQNRAESVRAYLVQKGVDSNRISAVGKGPSDPVADNGSPEGRADNRRVEIVVHNGGDSNGSNGSNNSNGK